MRQWGLAHQGKPPLPYPFRFLCRFKGRKGHVVLYQLCTVDLECMVHHLGSGSRATLELAPSIFQEELAPWQLVPTSACT